MDRVYGRLVRTTGRSAAVSETTRASMIGTVLPWPMFPNPRWIIATGRSSRGSIRSVRPRLTPLRPIGAISSISQHGAIGVDSFIRDPSTVWPCGVTWRI